MQRYTLPLELLNCSVITTLSLGSILSGWKGVKITWCLSILRFKVGLGLRMGSGKTANVMQNPPGKNNKQIWFSQWCIHLHFLASCKWKYIMPLFSLSHKQLMFFLSDPGQKDKVPHMQEALLYAFHAHLQITIVLVGSDAVCSTSLLLLHYVLL